MSILLKTSIRFVPISTTLVRFAVLRGSSLSSSVELTLELISPKQGSMSCPFGPPSSGFRCHLCLFHSLDSEGLYRLSNFFGRGHAHPPLFHNNRGGLVHPL
uniref:Uncharacterized protein n=1 Tax=Cannabis sativa TaxID=3483 RepID=A0A803PI95_CANSA